MKNNKKKPFFASFLEKQVQNPEEIQGGGLSTPLTDVLTLPTKDTVSTSPTLDGPITTLPSKDNVVTLKYPSDNDEIGGGIGPIIDPELMEP